MKLLLISSFMFYFLVSCASSKEQNTNTKKGSVDKEEIRQVIVQNKISIKKCYEDGLKHNKNISGKAVIQWSFTTGGVVTESKVLSSSLNRKDVENCLVELIKTLKFPEPPANSEAVVKFPFVFSTQ